MIVKREEKDDVINSLYSSSNICGSIFDNKTRDLIVIFNNGGRYKYSNVGLTDYTRFEIAESNGSVFNTYIKKKYSNFQKLDSLNKDELNKMLNEINNLKNGLIQ